RPRRRAGTAVPRAWRAPQREHARGNRRGDPARGRVCRHADRHRGDARAHRGSRAVRDRAGRAGRDRPSRSVTFSQQSAHSPERDIMTTAPERSVTFLPEPVPEKELAHLVISTDDHLIEPADMFAGRIPANLAERGPRIIDVNGVEAWQIEDQVLHNMGLNAVAGRPPEEWNDEPTNFEELRRG